MKTRKFRKKHGGMDIDSSESDNDSNTEIIYGNSYESDGTSDSGNSSNFKTSWDHYMNIYKNPTEMITKLLKDGVIRQAYFDDVIDLKTLKTNRNDLEYFVDWKNYHEDSKNEFDIYNKYKHGNYVGKIINVEDSEDYVLIECLRDNNGYKDEFYADFEEKINFNNNTSVQNLKNFISSWKHTPRAELTFMLKITFLNDDRNLYYDSREVSIIINRDSNGNITLSRASESDKKFIEIGSKLEGLYVVLNPGFFKKRQNSEDDKLANMFGTMDIDEDEDEDEDRNTKRRRGGKRKSTRKRKSTKKRKLTRKRKNTKRRK